MQHLTCKNKKSCQSAFPYTATRKTHIPPRKEEPFPLETRIGPHLPPCRVYCLVRGARRMEEQRLRESQLPNAFLSVLLDVTELGDGRFCLPNLGQGQKTLKMLLVEYVLVAYLGLSLHPRLLSFV
jgi:hypothetical protein